MTTLKNTQPVLFNGFSKDGIRFLKQLKKNNRRSWFKPRKAIYEEELKKPMQLFILELNRKLGTRLPEYQFDPKRSIFRIYRDTRFSSDKTPYKTHIAASFGRRGKKTEYERPGFYFHIEPGSIFIAGGIYMPNSAQLRLIRDAILENPERYLSLTHSKNFRKNFGTIQGEKLKRAPQGISPDHPLIEHLKHKQFYIAKEYPEKLAYEPKKLVRQVAQDFERMVPFIRWLTDTTSALRTLN